MMGGRVDRFAFAEQIGDDALFAFYSERAGALDRVSVSFGFLLYGASTWQAFRVRVWSRRCAAAGHADHGSVKDIT